MELSGKYDRFYASDLQAEPLPDIVVTGWPKDRFEAIVWLPGQGGVVLDVGCGNGLLLYQFRNRFRQMIGLEYSPRRLAQARVNLAGFNFLAISGSAESMLDIGTESVDRIISADTIEHVPDVYVTAAEMYRVLKRGGELVINTPNIAFIKKRALLLVGRFPSTSQPNEGLGGDILFDGGHLHYFTFRSLMLVLRRAGFDIKHRMGYGKLGRFHNFYPSLLSGGVQILAVKA